MSKSKRPKAKGKSHGKGKPERPTAVLSFDQEAGLIQWHAWLQQVTSSYGVPSAVMAIDSDMTFTSIAPAERVVTPVEVPDSLAVAERAYHGWVWHERNVRELLLRRAAELPVMARQRVRRARLAVVSWVTMVVATALDALGFVVSVAPLLFLCTVLGIASSVSAVRLLMRREPAAREAVRRLEDSHADAVIKLLHSGELFASLGGDRCAVPPPAPARRVLPGL